MSFQFVENDKIDGAARRRIRSHVMKGKNAGKTRLRPPRMSGMDEAIEPISVPRTIGNPFSFTAFPYELQPYMRDLIYQWLWSNSRMLYPPELCMPMNPMRAALFRYLQTDEAFLNSVLAMAQVWVDHLVGRPETSTRALLFLSKTYRCISENLQKYPTPPDSTVAAVMSMAVHEDLRGYPERGKVHIDGLQQIVKLRGGISKFEGNSFLLHKICRADIEYALYAGSRPRFNRDKFPQETVQSVIGDLITEGELSNTADLVEVVESDLQRILLDLAGACCLLNSDRSKFKLTPFEFQEVIISVSYRILHLHPVGGEGPKDHNDNACRLGLLALMSTLILQLGSTKKLHYDLLAEKLRNFIQNSSRSWPRDQTALLWLLFVGGVSVFGKTDREWLLPRIQSCLFALNIDDWQSARTKMKQLPWIDVIHDNPGHMLWQAVAWQ